MPPHTGGLPRLRAGHLKIVANSVPYAAPVTAHRVTPSRQCSGFHRGTLPPRRRFVQASPDDRLPTRWGKPPRWTLPGVGLRLFAGRVLIKSRSTGLRAECGAQMAIEARGLLFAAGTLVVWTFDLPRRAGWCCAVIAAARLERTTPHTFPPRSAEAESRRGARPPPGWSMAGGRPLPSRAVEAIRQPTGRDAPSEPPPSRT